MKILPFDAGSLRQKDVLAFLETYDYLCTRYSLRFVEQMQFNVNWSDLICLSSVNSFILKHVIELQAAKLPTYLLWPQVNDEYTAGKPTYVVWGIIEMKNSMGYSSFKRKTIADRIHNLFYKIPKTGYEKFDRQFQLTSLDSDTSQLHLGRKIMDCMQSFQLEGLAFELYDRLLIIRSNAAVQTINAERMTALLLRLSKIE